MRNLITILLALAALPIAAQAQSRILDTSYPVRVNETTLQVIVPTLAKFMASNDVASATTQTNHEARVTALEGTQAGGTLLPARILVGNATSNATGVAVSGDVTISAAGAVAIVTNTIVNADIKSDAGIVATKLSSAVQDSLGKADTALQPAGGVTATNTIIGADSTTNVIVVIGGQLTSWTVTP